MFVCAVCVICHYMCRMFVLLYVCAVSLVLCAVWWYYVLHVLCVVFAVHYVCAICVVRNMECVCCTRRIYLLRATWYLVYVWNALYVLGTRISGVVGRARGCFFPAADAVSRYVPPSFLSGPALRLPCASWRLQARISCIGHLLSVQNHATK